MRDAEIALQRIRHAVGQHCQRDRRCVRRHNGSRRTQLVDSLVEGFLDVEALDDCLRNPVCIGDQRQVVFDVPRRNQLRKIRVHECRRARLQQPLHGALGEPVTAAVTLSRHVEHHHRHTGIGQMTGDAGPHGARADDRRLPDTRHECFPGPLNSARSEYA